MTNTDIARIAAIDIESQLPREIQDLILQTVVLRYYNFYNFDDFRLRLTNRTNRFVQQFAKFALSKSTTRMYKFSTNYTDSLSPLVAKLMEFTFEQTITEFYHGLELQSPDLQVPAFEQCSTLKFCTRTIEHVCLSGLLTRSNKLKILKLSIDMAVDKAHLLNEFTKEIRNWFNVNPRNKTEKSLILDIDRTSLPNTEFFGLYNLSEIDTFLKSTKELISRLHTEFRLCRI
ncbi:unnamed protein product [Ambrosiozyma monospora]|uniref:Unnamed protein product n=1 Tax=Ambrosiozyma monospora TaxID=43982 RepID=A0A9W7DGG8_AMBMO|nr:unnamed protein product [Ambrosiozyma monospora]